jgi:nitrous oxide reductase accessory protein NosL
MKKTFAAALLIAVSLAACGSKKENTTPVNKEPAMEQKTDATGGAAYGKKADAPAAPK